jgi:excinuclease UvrABC nuclease subunit
MSVTTISTLQGWFVGGITGGLHCRRAGQVIVRHYRIRTFKARTISPCSKEVFERRLKATRPADLIVIDGGKAS